MEVNAPNMFQSEAVQTQYVNLPHGQMRHPRITFEIPLQPRQHRWDRLAPGLFQRLANRNVVLETLRPSFARQRLFTGQRIFRMRRQLGGVCLGGGALRAAFVYVLRYDHKREIAGEGRTHLCNMNGTFHS